MNMSIYIYTICPLHCYKASKKRLLAMSAAPWVTAKLKATDSDIQASSHQLTDLNDYPQKLITLTAALDRRLATYAKFATVHIDIECEFDELRVRIPANNAAKHDNLDSTA